MTQFNLVEGNVGIVKPLRQAGQSQVLNFSLASTTYFGDKQYTTWYEVELWGADAAAHAKAISKGRRLIVKGNVKAEAYVNKDGEAVAKLKLRAKTIGFVMGKPKSQEAPKPPPAPPITDGDDIPF